MGSISDVSQLERDAGAMGTSGDFHSPQRVATPCRLVIILAIVVAGVGYGWVVHKAWIVGRQIEADPHLISYAGLPESDPSFNEATALTLDGWWWWPVAAGSEEPIRFGARIVNNGDHAWHSVAVVFLATDKHGNLLARPVARANPSTLRPGDVGICEGSFAPPDEVLRFSVRVTGVEEPEP